MMFSSGSPGAIADGKWIKNTIHINGKPAYYNNTLLLYYENGSWLIEQNSDIIVKSHSFGSHPMSVHKGEWGDNIVPWGDFRFYFYENSFDNPCLLEDVGEDFFLRVKSRRIWFIDPISNTVQHSGAKKSMGIQGKQFCALCNKLISSNNFAFQHVRKLHTIPNRCNTIGELYESLILL